MSHVTHGRVISHMSWAEFECETATSSCVVSHMNESCHIWLSHVTQKWVVSHMNASCDTWISHVIKMWRVAVCVALPGTIRIWCVCVYSSIYVCVYVSIYVCVCVSICFRVGVSIYVSPRQHYNLYFPRMESIEMTLAVVLSFNLNVVFVRVL